MKVRVVCSLNGIRWNEVTWLSKLVTLIICFGVVPALSFFVGMQSSRH